MSLLDMSFEGQKSFYSSVKARIAGASTPLQRFNEAKADREKIEAAIWKEKTLAEKTAIEIEETDRLRAQLKQLQDARIERTNLTPNPDWHIAFLDFIENFGRVIVDDRKWYRGKGKVIVRQIAEKYGFTSAEIAAQSRSANLVHARQEAMYELRLQSPLSLPQISKEFGRKMDHTTVLAGIQAHCLRNRLKLPMGMSWSPRLAARARAAGLVDDEGGDAA
jgi:Bacterial dnaA protein helix-turn-helix